MSDLIQIVAGLVVVFAVLGYMERRRVKRRLAKRLEDICRDTWSKQE